MTATETAKLCKIIRSLSPAAAKAFDEDTPAVWFGVLAGVLYADALEAVQRLASRTPWIGTAEICAEVAVIRRARVQAAEAVDEVVPNVDPDDHAAYRAERLAIMRAAADGVLDVDAYVASGQTLTGLPARRATGALDPTGPGRIREAIRAVTARPEAS